MRLLVGLLVLLVLLPFIILGFLARAVVSAFQTGYISVAEAFTDWQSGEE